MPDGHQNADYVLRSAFAGGLAGCAAKTLIAPLDRVKILFQTRNPAFTEFAGTMMGLPRAARKIIAQEGSWGLFRGHSATLIRVFPYAAIKFVAYEQIRGVLIPTVAEETHLRRFITGSLSGICSVFVTYPLDVIRVQLAYGGRADAQSQPGRPPLLSKHRLLNTVYDIYHQTPIVAQRPPAVAPEAVLQAPASYPPPRLRNFYTGFLPTLLGIIPYAGVSFFAHDFCHDIFRMPFLRDYAVNFDVSLNKNNSSHRKHPLRNWAELTAGGLSGLLAQTASYPLEVVRRRMQVAGLTHQRSSLMNVFRTIHAENGLRGFFVGLSIGYIKVIPMFACSFFVYERLKYILGI